MLELRYSSIKTLDFLQELIEMEARRELVKQNVARTLPVETYRSFCFFMETIFCLIILFMCLIVGLMPIILLVVSYVLFLSPTSAATLLQLSHTTRNTQANLNQLFNH